jgi:hypothetical protein
VDGRGERPTESGLGQRQTDSANWPTENGIGQLKKKTGTVDRYPFI